MIKTHTFSGGEVQIEFKKSEFHKTSADYTLDARDYNNDLMAIAQAKSIYDKQMPHATSYLKIPYMPYSRHDREMAADGYHGSNALKIFGKFINSLDFDNVITFDPHSDVCEAVIDNLHIETNLSLVEKALKYSDITFSTIHVAIPDVGASKKIYELVKFLKLKGFDKKIVLHQCEKHRDPATGNITHTSIPASLSQLPENTSVVIIDDICDGGRSFIEIAKLAPYLSWELVVTHGIFSKGLPVLLEHFDYIYTTDSFKQIGHDRLFTMKI